MEVTVTTRSEEETLSLAREIGRRLSAGDVVAMKGELGAGKSVLARGMCQGLGIRQRTRSPSFAFVNHYRGPVSVYHIDLYRVQGPGDLETLGLEELLVSENLILVEWAEKMEHLIPSRALEISVEIAGEDERKITLRASTEKHSKILTELAGAEK